MRPYFLLALLAGALVLTFFIYKPFLAPLVLAAAFAVVLQPVHHYLQRRVKRPSLAALATVVIAAMCVLIPVGILATHLVGEARELYSALSEGEGRGYLDAALGQVGQFAPGLGFSEFAAQADTLVRQLLERVIQNTGAVFANVASLFLSLFVFFVALYYLLRDGKGLLRYLVELSPLRDEDDEAVFDRLQLAVNSVIKGSLAVALVQGTLTAIGFMIFGVPNAVLWGTVAAIAALVPGVGTSLVIAPAILFLFLGGSTFAAGGLLLWGVVAVGLVDNFLGPKLVSRGTHLHPLLILLAVLGGLFFFGPVGIFLGPLTVSLLFAFLTIYTQVANGKRV